MQGNIPPANEVSSAIADGRRAVLAETGEEGDTVSDRGKIYSEYPESPPGAAAGAGRYNQDQSWYKSHVRSTESPVGGSIVALSGVMIIVSVFLPWIAGISGWDLMFSGQFGTSHNFLFSYYQGLFFFSGFLALLFGLLILAGGVMRIFGWENGEVLILLASLFSIAVVTVNIVFAYAKGVPGFDSPGGGVWLFAVFALLAFIFGLVSWPAEEYVVSDRY
jgi:hypothetical protein